MGTLHSQSKEETSRLNFAHYGGTFSGSIRHLLRSETATDHANVDARFSALQAHATRCEALPVFGEIVQPLAPPSGD